MARMNKVDNILLELRRLNANVETLVQLLTEREHAGGAPHLAHLKRLNTRQHAIIQMLCAGASNEEIRTRLEGTMASTKMHVRRLCEKFGVSNRVELMIELSPILDGLDGHVYETLSGGLPKDWSMRRGGEDPYRHLYVYADKELKDGKGKV